MTRNFTSNFLLTVFCGFLLATGLASPVNAHEAWLEPVSYKLAAGDALKANYKIGSNYKGNSQPFISRWNRDYKITVGNRFAEITGEDGQRPSVHLAEAIEGLNILTLHTSTSKLKFNKWEKFTSYLKSEGLEEIEAEHLERGLPKEGFTEGYRRNAKALVQVGDKKEADRAIGLPLEFVVLDGLYGDEGDPIEIELLWDGKPQAGVQVQVWDARNIKKTGDEGADEKQQTYFTTDDDGRFSFTPRLGGVFMMSSVHMISPAEKDENGELKYAWESFWANLTFAR